MAKFTTYLEVSPLGLHPNLYQFGPVRNARVFRERWLRWFYLAELPQRKIKLLIGPFRSRRGARRAWDMVKGTYTDWYEQQERLTKDIGHEARLSKVPFYVEDERPHFAEDIFSSGRKGGGPADARSQPAPVSDRVA